jgi:hypothetical protein
MSIRYVTVGADLSALLGSSNKSNPFTHHASSLSNMIYIFFAEQFDTTRNTTRSSISQWTERFATDVITDIHE